VPLAGLKHLEPLLETPVADSIRNHRFDSFAGLPGGWFFTPGADRQPASVTGDVFCGVRLSS